MVKRYVTDFAKIIPPSSHILAFYNTPNDKWNILSANIKRNLEKEQSISPSEIIRLMNGEVKDISE